MSQDADVTLELLEEIVAAFNRHDVDRIAEAFAEDGVFVLAAGPEPWGTKFEGRDTIREAIAQRLAAVPDIQWTDGKHWIMGNKALSEWRVQGTLPSGERLDCDGCDLWEFKQGKVVKKDTYYKQVVPG